MVADKYYPVLELQVIVKYLYIISIKWAKILPLREKNCIKTQRKTIVV